MQTKQHLFKSTEPQEPANGEILPLNQRPEYQEPLKELQALEALHAERERERKKLLARNRGEKTKTTPTELARALLKGGRIDPTPVPDKLEAINQELLILRQAIGVKTRALDAVATELSYEQGIRAKPQFDAALVRAFNCLERAVAGFVEAETIAERLRRAGYRLSSATMPNLEPMGIASLRMTGLEHFRRELAAMGAL